MGRQSYKWKIDCEHRVHAEHKEAAKQYTRMLKSTKEQHWRSWLERVKDPDIYAVQRLISTLASNGGKVRIPELKYKEGDIDKMATSNIEKGVALAKGFFPWKPQMQDPQEGAVYPKECSKAGKVTEEQI